MKVIPFIILIIVIAMLLHIMLTNLLFGLSLRKSKFQCYKFWILKAIIDFIVLCGIVTINVLLNDTDYSPISCFINGYIIGYIISNYYVKYL